VAALDAQERARPPIWWSYNSSTGDINQTNDGSGGSDKDEFEGKGGQPSVDSWSSKFAALFDRPIDEVVGRLLELGTRQWQLVWARLLDDFTLGLEKARNHDCNFPAVTTMAQALPFDGEARAESTTQSPAWDEACRILSQMVDAEAATDPQGSWRDAVNALRRLLRLQEQLTWLARVIATAIVFDQLHAPLLAVLSTHNASGADMSRPQRGELRRIAQRLERSQEAVAALGVLDHNACRL
jgi:hypothetical protein